MGHNRAWKRPYRCWWCGAGFNNRWAFEAHYTAEEAARQMEMDFVSRTAGPGLRGLEVDRVSAPAPDSADAPPPQPERLK